MSSVFSITPDLEGRYKQPMLSLGSKTPTLESMKEDLYNQPFVDKKELQKSIDKEKYEHNLKKISEYEQSIQEKQKKLKYYKELVSESPVSKNPINLGIALSFVLFILPFISLLFIIGSPQQILIPIYDTPDTSTPVSKKIYYEPDDPYIKSIYFNIKQYYIWLTVLNFSFNLIFIIFSKIISINKLYGAIIYLCIANFIFIGIIDTEYNKIYVGNEVIAVKNDQNGIDIKFIQVPKSLREWIDYYDYGGKSNTFKYALLFYSIGLFLFTILYFFPVGKILINHLAKILRQKEYIVIIILLFIIIFVVSLSVYFTITYLSSQK